LQTVVCLRCICMYKTNIKISIYTGTSICVSLSLKIKLNNSELIGVPNGLSKYAKLEKFIIKNCFGSEAHIGIC